MKHNKATFTTTTLDILSPTSRDITALEVEEEEGTTEIEHPRDTGRGKRREPRAAGGGAADEPRVRLEAGVEGNCHWLGHTDGAEGAFSLF